MPRRRPTIKRAIATCVQALITASNRVPLVGFLVAGALIWLAFWMRSHPPTAWEIANRSLFWIALVVAACFLVLGVAGFIETMTGQRRARRASSSKTA